jgi:hypothetical protein
MAYIVSNPYMQWFILEEFYLSIYKMCGKLKYHQKFISSYGCFLLIGFSPRDNLVKRQNLDDLTCVFCNENENSTHLFFECVVPIYFVRDFACD